MLGDVVDELYEPKNVRVLKSYVKSFASNVDIKFSRQACLPSKLFGPELFTLNAS